MITDRRIGILGGMGAAATFNFYERLVRYCRWLGARTDQDFPETVIYSLRPSGWNETGVVNEKAALCSMIRGIHALNLSDVDLIVMACNTAHLYIETLRQFSSVPIWNMVEETVRSLDGIKYGVLCSKTSADRKLYGDAVYPGKTTQFALERVIGRVLCCEHGADDVDVVEGAIRRLLEDGAEKVVIGCTELSAVSCAGVRVVDVVDAIDVIIERVLTS